MHGLTFNNCGGVKKPYTLQKTPIRNEHDLQSFYIPFEVCV